MMVKELFLRSTLDEMKADKKITHLKELLADNRKLLMLELALGSWSRHCLFDSIAVSVFADISIEF